MVTNATPSAIDRAAVDGTTTDGTTTALGADTQRSRYWSQLLDRVTAAVEDGPVWLTDMRATAKAIAQELTLPSTRDEDWRFTSLAPLLESEFEPVAATLEVDAAARDDVALAECAGTRLVFVNGRYCAALSDCSSLPKGVAVGHRGDAGFEDAWLGAWVGQVQGTSDAFAALNGAAMEDLAIVRVERNAIVEVPIHLLFLSSATEVAAIAQPRCLIVAEAGSTCTLVEEYATVKRSWCQQSSEDCPYLVNGVTEIAIAENAQVTHARVQRDTAHAFHVGTTAVRQARDSRYAIAAVSTGSRLSRHNLDITQAGPGTETRLNGLTVAAGQQVADLHSFLNLQHPHGVTDQLHKCIAAGRGRAVFNGRVFVGQQAQHTDAAQLNRNLLLSSKARVDTKPQLEIIADDVKCTHGATVSQLEDDEVFYLRSRGLDADSARSLLLDGFAGEILAQLPAQALRTQLARCLACELGF